MNRKCKREALAYMVGEDSPDLYDVPSVKVGDGAISIEYVDTSSNHPYVGIITVFSNGAMSCSITNRDYKEMLSQDYLTISGDGKEPESVDFGAYTFITSEDNDPERFKRIKQFLVDNNIELKYASEQEMDNERLEQYEDLNIDDLIEYENIIEDRENDEDEFHPKHF